MSLDRNVEVAYVLKVFPRFSQTFVLSELLAHEEAGLPLHLRDLFERPERYEVLPNDLAAVQAFMARANELGYLVNLDTDLRLDKPELQISIDRERASDVGVSVTDIGTTLEAYLGGRVAGDFKRGAKQYDVVLQMRAQGDSNRINQRLRDLALRLLTNACVEE